MLYKIIRPDQAANINKDNPFSTKSHQLRNFLIVHLMMNYGLRVGELMLLTKRSIKKSINSDSYSLIVTNTDDEHDSRQRKPSIKNEQSYRVIKLDSMDYKFLMLYMALLHKDLKCKAPLIEPNLRRNLGKWST